MSEGYRKTILLVEKQGNSTVSNNESYKKDLEKLGYDVVAADTGEEAMQIAGSDADIDLVLINVDLGDGTDGIQASEAILGKRDLPIVFMLSDPDAETLDKVERIASYGFVTRNSSAAEWDLSIKMALRLFEANKSTRKELDERKRIEEELRFLSMIPENMFDSVIATDRSFRITYVNKRTEQLFGYSSEELLGQMPDMFDAEPLADELQKKVYETVLAGKTYTGESLNRRKDGSLFICDYRVSPMFDETGKITGYLGVQRDISRQREMEKALLESNKRLDLFFSQSFSGFFFMTLDEPVAWNDDADKEALIDYIMAHERITKVNQAMLDQYGAREEDFIGLTPNDLFAHDLEHARRICKELFDKGHCRVETREQKMDGTPIIIDGDYICLYDEKGRVAGHFGVQKEVTEQKEAFQKIEESEKKFADAFNLLRGVLESSKDMVVFALDRNYRYLTFNRNHQKTMKQIWGADIATGNSMLAYIRDSSDRQKAKANFDRALAGEAFTLTEQYGDIARRWYENIYNPLYDAKGDIIGLTLFLSDITEQKEMEDTLHMNQQRLSQAQTFARAGNWEYDIKSERLYWSPECEALFGLDEGSFGGTFEDFLALVHPDDKDYVIEKNAPVTDVKEGIPLEYEHRIITKTGETRWMRESAGVVNDPEGNPIKINGFILDITERKRTEDALRESEQKLSSILNNMTDVVWSLTYPDMALNYISPSVEKLYGRAPDEFHEKPQLWQEVVHPDDQHLSEKALSDVLEKGFAVRECRVLRPDGNVLWVLDKSKVVYDDNNKPIRIEGIVHDITDRKRAEELLRQSEQRFQRMLDLIPDMVSIHDPDMNIVYSNWNGFGAVPQEKRTPNTKCYKTYRNRDDICPDCKAVNVLKTKKAFQTTAELPEGMWVDLRVIPILNSNEEVEYFVEWVRDITDIKQSEQEAKQQQKLLEGLFDGVSDVLAIQRPDYTIERYNQAGYDLLGMTPEQVKGKKCYELIGRDRECENCPTSLALQTKKLEETEKYFPELNVILNCRSNPILDEDGNIVQIVEQLRDITDRKLAEKAVEKSVEEKNVLLSEIHHRVKNNMAVISSMLLLQSEFGEQKKDPEKLLKDLQTRILSMSWVHELVYESKDFAQIQSVKLLQRLADHLNNSYGPDDKEILMQVHSDDIMLDMNNSVPLTLLIAEVLTNAWKHAFPGRRTGRIEVVLEKREKDFYLVIRDDGVGVANLEKLRQPDSFGYTIVHGLAQQLRGELSFSSPAEGGLQVEAWFPDARTTKVP